jgi:hypothetical protein
MFMVKLTQNSQRNGPLAPEIRRITAGENTTNTLLFCNETGIIA